MALLKLSEAGVGSAYLICDFTDVLIASLTDTLAEHPELVSAAREGLLEGSSGNQLLHQLLMFNQASPGGVMASVYLVAKVYRHPTCYRAEELRYHIQFSPQSYYHVSFKAS
jgi:hypothetical protein